MTSSAPDGWAQRVLAGIREQARDAPVERYECLEELGHGAMGVVFRARDRRLEREVAFKMLRDDVKPQNLARFRREAEVTARLSHPNVVSVLDSGEARGRAFIVMELVKGEPFDRTLARRALGRRALVAVLAKVARGVQHAHERGVVHRDLKPSNILIPESGEPKVSDFGAAHLLDADSVLTGTGMLTGTPSYMSPEQAAQRNEDVSPRTDVYALGVILYEIVTGRLPHVRPTIVKLLQAIAGDEPVAPRRLDERLSPDLEAVILCALEKDPRRRYPSALALAEDLERWLDGEHVAARPPSWLRRAVRGMARNRALALASGVALTALLVAVATAMWTAVAERARRGRDAMALVREGSHALDEERRTRDELATARVAIAALRASIDRSADESERRPLWALEKQVEALESRAGLQRAAAVDAYTRALGVDPSCDEARDGLGLFHETALEEAEAAGDGARIALETRLVSIYGSPAARARLAAAATLALDSRPAGAEVHVFRYEESDDRRLVPLPFDLSARGTIAAAAPLDCSPRNRLGACPVARDGIPPGSYLLVFRLAGHVDVRYPVLLRRGARLEVTIALSTEEELGAGLVPILGAPGLGDFAIGRFEVTLGEYVEFIRDLARTAGPAEAQKRIPSWNGQPLWNAGDGSIDSIREDLLKGPAVDVTWVDATEYCRWLGERSGSRHIPYRLPTEAEWERAAAGADGRIYPWGNHFDATFVFIFTGENRPGPNSTFLPVGSFWKDESPYGVRDMAGSLPEWVDGWYDKRHGLRPVRGGSCLAFEEVYFRIGRRDGGDPENTRNVFGFRVARSLSMPGQAR